MQLREGMVFIERADHQRRTIESLTVGGYRGDTRLMYRRSDGQVFRRDYDTILAWIADGRWQLQYPKHLALPEGV